MVARKLKNGLYQSESSGMWHYEFRLKGRKYKGCTGCIYKSDAAAFLAEKKSAVVRECEGLEPPPAHVPTLLQALGKWAQAMRGSVTDKHIKECQNSLLRHCGPILAVPLNKIDTTAVDALRVAYLTGSWRGPTWKEGTKDKPRLPGGWNLIWRHLQGVVNWSIERGMLQQKAFKGRTVKAQERVRPALWPELVGYFLAMVDGLTAEQDMKTAIHLMVRLGLRESEALGARWEWFDQRRGVYQLGQTKNRKRREIALPPGLFEYLQNAHGRHESGLVLRGQGPNGQHGAGYTKTIIGIAGQLVGIEGLHPHGLRAAFATAHWEANTPLSQITAMLGHSAPQTTMGYIRQRDRDTFEAQNRVAQNMRL